jgi:5-hydroxyisourate hydrolase
MNAANSAGRITTHVLDTAAGRPAAGLKIDFYRLEGSARELVKSVTTNDDGRCDDPLLSGDAMTAGVFELVFHVGDYLDRSDDVSFLDQVPVRFGIADLTAHYHVPLLVSPFAYSTYRGS